MQAIQDSGQAFLLLTGPVHSTVYSEQSTLYSTLHRMIAMPEARVLKKLSLAWAWLKFPWFTTKFLEGMQKLDFSPKLYFAVLFFEVSAWLSNHAVCRLGLRIFCLNLDQYERLSRYWDDNWSVSFCGVSFYGERGWPSFLITVASKRIYHILDRVNIFQASSPSLSPSYWIS